MKLKEGIGWKGNVSFGVIDKETVDKIGMDLFLKSVRAGKAKFKREYKQHNVVTDMARGLIAQMITSPAYTAWELPSQIRLGTSKQAASSSDINLYAGVAATTKICSTVQVYNDYFAQYIAVWQTTDPIQGTWTEAGLFDVTLDLWARSVFNITVNAGEMLIAQWQVQIISD